MSGGTIKNEDTTDKNGGVFKKGVCERIVVFLEEKEYKNVSTNAPYFQGKYITVDSYNGDCAFFIAYNRSGIIYMQYTNEGKLVTFDGKAFKVEDGGSFVNHRNPSNP